MQEMRPRIIRRVRRAHLVLRLRIPRALGTSGMRVWLCLLLRCLERIEECLNVRRNPFFINGLGVQPAAAKPLFESDCISLSCKGQQRRPCTCRNIFRSPRLRLIPIQIFLPAERLNVHHGRNSRQLGVFYRGLAFAAGWGSASAAWMTRESRKLPYTGRLEGTKRTPSRGC